MKKQIPLTKIEAPENVKVKVANLPSAAALSSSACLAIFKKTSSSVVRLNWMSDIPNSFSLSWSSSKNFYSGLEVPKKEKTKFFKTKQKKKNKNSVSKPKIN
jgi:hypothetical protein